MLHVAIALILLPVQAGKSYYSGGSGIIFSQALLKRLGQASHVLACLCLSSPTAGAFGPKLIK